MVVVILLHNDKFIGVAALRDIKEAEAQYCAIDQTLSVSMEDQESVGDSHGPSSQGAADGVVLFQQMFKQAIDSNNSDDNLERAQQMV